MLNMLNICMCLLLNQGSQNFTPTQAEGSMESTPAAVGFPLSFQLYLLFFPFLVQYLLPYQLQ